MQTNMKNMINQENISRKNLINEEYRHWKKNAPYLYDMVVSHSLVWPSLSVQFFPDVIKDTENSTITQRLLITSHSDCEEDNCINILTVCIPSTTFENECSQDIEWNIEQQMCLRSDINRARIHHKMSNIIAVRSDSKDVFIINCAKHLNPERTFVPDKTLSGHEMGGYGLSWNYNSRNILATSGDDGLVCVFDIGKNTVSKHTGHVGIVCDCSFSFFNSKILYSCGDDRNIVIWDLRKDKSEKIENAHTQEVNAIGCSALEDNVLCTGSKDASVKVWDMRMTKKAVFTLLSHKKDIFQVQFSPHFSNILASAGKDRRVCVWDLDRIGTVQNAEEKEEGPPELLFLHGGHTDTVVDLAFNPIEPWEIASVAEDNIIQLWQIAEHIMSDS